MFMHQSYHEIQCLLHFMLDQTGIWGVWRLGQCLGYLSCSCFFDAVGLIVLLDETTGIGAQGCGWPGTILS